MGTGEVAEAAPPATAPHLPHRLPPPKLHHLRRTPPPPLRHASRRTRLTHREATVAPRPSLPGRARSRARQGHSLPWMLTGLPPPCCSWRRDLGRRRGGRLAPAARTHLLGLPRGVRGRVGRGHRWQRGRPVRD
jgi:hypothetical protein